MKRWTLDPRALVAPALAVATVATFASGALADRGGRRFQGEARVARSSYRAPGGFTVQRSYVGGAGSSYRAPGGFTVHRSYVGGAGGSYTGPGGFVIHRQVIAPRPYHGYYGGYYGYYGPRFHVHFGAYPVYTPYPVYAPYPVPDYVALGAYLIEGPVTGGFVCGPVDGGDSFSITLHNTLPSGEYYYDPYCHEAFSSLGAYYEHCQGLHPAEVRVCQRGNPAYTNGYNDEPDDDGYYDDRGHDDRNYDNRRNQDNQNNNDDDDDDGGNQQR
jgi:hypothetical protein